MLEIFKLFGRVTIDSEEADKDIEKIDKNAKKTSLSLEEMTTKAAKWSAAIAAGLTVAVGAITSMANSAADATDRIDKLSQRLGISREGFQEWEFVLSQSGSTMESLQSGMKVMVQRLDDLKSGVGPGAEAFEKLGIRWRDVRKLSQEDIFALTVKRFNEMEDGAEKAALAQELFSRSGQELLPLLNTNSEAIDEMRQKANDLGLVLGDDVIDAGVQFTDAMDQFNRTLGSIATRIGVSLMPLVLKLIDAFRNNSDTIIAVVNVAFSTFAKIIEVVVNNLNILLPLLLGIISAFTAMKIIGVVTALMNAYKASAFAATIAQSGLNAAMLANPIGLLVVGIGALIAIFTLLVLNFDKVKAAFETVVRDLTTGVKFIVDTYVTAFKTIFNAVMNMRNSIKEAFISMFETVAQVGKNIFSAAINSVKAFINTIFSFINSMAERAEKLLNFKLPDFLGGNEVGIKLPRIPMLANGGTVGVGGMAMINEFEPELVNLPSGATVTPLSRMSEIPNMGNGGTNFNAPVTVQISAKDVKEFNDVIEFFQAVPRLGGAY